MIHLKEIFATLNEHKVKYLLCGGIAINIYGIPRSTADLDLLLDWEEQNLLQFEKAIAQHGYKKNLFFEIKTLLNTALREQYIRDKNLIVYSYSSSDLQAMTLDVLVDVPLNFNECWERRTIKQLGDVPVNVLSVDDLIKLKEYANRAQDYEDILNLKKFFKK